LSAPPTECHDIHPFPHLSLLIYFCRPSYILHFDTKLCNWFIVRKEINLFIWYRVHLSCTVMLKTLDVRYRLWLFCGLCMQPSFKFQSPTHHSRDLIPAPKS
jgi:hypothetical protein